MQALAVKYRPHDWSAVVEQDAIKIILQNQLDTNELYHSYLFCGGAGTGKTTCARILANEINKGKGVPIELDAASNNGVDDVREIIQQAKKKSLDSEYKIFIIDECHAISNNGWQAFLKLIEEPPETSIFIFCTTDPQKIPKTIISRVQRFDFKRISQKGIVDRLRYICDREITGEDGLVRLDALEYLAKIADGGMRDAITLMDKCLSYSKDLTVGNVIAALGTVDYKTMVELTKALQEHNTERVITCIEAIHSSGKDLKNFISQYVQFLLDVNKVALGCDEQHIALPKTDDIANLFGYLDGHEGSWDYMLTLLDICMKLKTSIKYSQSAKYDIESVLLLECAGGAEK